MKKTLTVIVLMAVILVGPRAAVAAGSHKSGSLVISGQTIYLIGYGQKRGFQSWNEFLSYHYRASRIKPANEADKRLPEGPPMRAKAGTLAWDISDMQTVYLIGKDGEKRGFTSLAALKKYQKKHSVIWPINLHDYPLGESIE